MYITIIGTMQAKLVFRTRKKRVERRACLARIIQLSSISFGSLWYHTIYSSRKMFVYSSLFN